MMCHFATSTGVFIMLALMIERYRTLCTRFSTAVYSHNSSLKRTYIILTAVTISAFIFSIPRFFEASVKYDYIHQHYIIHKTILLESKIYIILYRILGSLLFYSALPYVIIFLLSFRILKKIQTASLERVQLQGYRYSVTSFLNTYNPFNDTEKFNNEKIFLAISFKFLFFRLASTSFDVIEQLIGVEPFVGPTIALFFVNINNLFVIISSTLNFFIFWHYSNNFKKASGRFCYKVFTCNGYLSWWRILGRIIDFTIWLLF